MCLQTLNTKKEHQRLLDEMTFPIKMYKIVSLKTDTNQIFPLYTYIGRERAYDSLKYQYRMGKNKAIQKQVNTTAVVPSVYTTGFHVIKDKEKALEVVNEFVEEFEPNRTLKVMEVIVEKPEHLTNSGKDSLPMSRYDKITEVMTFVALKMTVKKILKN